MKPLVLLPADVKTIDGLPFHCVGEKYIRACSRYAGVSVLGGPAHIAGADADPCEVLQHFDGVLLTGSHAHVDPARYNGNALDQGEAMLDRQRDECVFTTIAAALKLSLPILGICRGMQEINVAFGGTLTAQLHQHNSKIDHRENKSLPVVQRYGPRHEIIPEAGGIIEELAAGTTPTVNSLHTQGIDQLGADLRIEARAPDGLIEAVAHTKADSWLVGVQWHCEADANDNPFYQALFAAFGAQVHKHARQRQAGQAG